MNTAQGRKRFSRKQKRTVFFMVMGVFVAIGTLAPIVWMFLTSVMSPKDLSASPLKLIPRTLTFSRYQEIFRSLDTKSAAYVFRIALRNTSIVALTVTLLSLVIGSMAAYAFARLRFRGRDKLMLVTLFTYMLPPVALVIPMYALFQKVGLLDSRAGLAIVYLTLIIPFIIWVMQGYFGSISRAIEEAAEIDGATRLQTFLYIFVPMARPGAVATGILAFLMAWDEFFYSLIFTASLNSKTITVAISEFNGKFTIDYGMISAAGVIGSLIPVLITLIFQKYIVIGMTAGGVKE